MAYRRSFLGSGRDSTHGPLGLALTSVLTLAVPVGCGDAAAESDSFGDDGPMNETLPPWSMCDTDPEGCATDSGGTSTDVPDEGCVGTEDCMDGVCAAAFDRANEEIGPFECQFTCIADLDDDQWCRDDASCCTPGAVCTARGYCVVDDGSGTDSGSTTDDGGSTSDGTTSGRDTDTDTDTDTDGTGSTTGGG